jgi:subtilisin family serine protease
MKIRSVSIALAGSVILAACADQPTAVQPVVRKAAVANAAAGRYILVGNAFGAGFADKIAALGGSVETVHQGAGIAVVSGISDAASAQLAGLGGVTSVQPDMIIKLATPVAGSDVNSSYAVADATIESQGNPTTASRYAWQWNMKQIGADKAWAAGKLGSSGVTVAILDTGIDYDAPDLNGLVDLSRSVSFIPGDDKITATYFPSRNKISDYHGHGTNVATQVSSKAVALAGVTSKTTLIGVKVLDGSGSGPFSAILNGVLWAADHGADVANMSLGGGFAKAGNGIYVAAINKTFNYAKQKGMLVVVSAGNDAADLDHNGNFNSDYCDAPQVVCVAAEGPQKWADAADPVLSSAPSDFTNFGRSAITVAAPGGNYEVGTDGKVKVSAWPWGNDVASWVWSYCSKTALVFDEDTGAILGYAGCQAGNRLRGYVGTSQASPHVTGLAALLVAEQGRGQPSQIKAAIVKSAVDLGQTGTDPYYGRGRISVANALGL